jgi:hypothetical protein
MRKMRVKSPHIWNRREFNVASAGYFTVLKPTGWFAASRLPGGFRYVGGQAKAVASRQGHEISVGNPTAAHQHAWTSVPDEWSTKDHHLMRSALVVLGATAITSVLLWWIAFPRFH